MLRLHACSTQDSQVRQICYCHVMTASTQYALQNPYRQTSYRQTHTISPIPQNQMHLTASVTLRSLSEARARTHTHTHTHTHTPLVGGE